MTVRRRLCTVLFTPVAVPLAAGLVVTVLLTVHAVAPTDGDRGRAGAPAAVDAGVPPAPTGPRLVFRHTGIDEHFGLVASVPLADPTAPRTFTTVACDRIDATASTTSCLRLERRAGTRFEQVLLDQRGTIADRVPLAGVPSRTRLSPDSSLVASTSFVAGHEYQQDGYSTATEIRAVDGSSHADLESFSLVIDGRPASAPDRNVWGVTFVDDATFYATVATGGRTYLVHGDLAARSLTTVRKNAECPSVSPDRTQVAYKVDVPGPDTRWSFAVLDLATGRQRVLRGETADVDDQVAWLDDETLLYGLPRADQPGVTDVWALGTEAGARPRLFVDHAWSPAVVRP